MLISDNRIEVVACFILDFRRLGHSNNLNDSAIHTLSLFKISYEIKTRPRGYKTWVHSPTQNKVQWLAAWGHVSASSQSFRFILSWRLCSSFITLRPVLCSLIAFTEWLIKANGDCNFTWNLNQSMDQCIHGNTQQFDPLGSLRLPPIQWMTRWEISTSNIWKERAHG